MISADENPGLFMFMIGIVVLVMAAVGLSVMMDKHIRFSRGGDLLRDDIASYSAEIGDLVALRDEETKDLATLSARLSSNAREHGAVQARAGEFQGRKDLLETSKAGLASEIEAAEARFAAYRATYRRQVWAAAPGESLGDLTVRGGRVYAGATVTRVTDVGLEIRHENGIARIQAPDLDEKFQERFQWNDEERRGRLKRESADQLAIAKGPDEPAPPVKPVSARKDRKPAKVVADPEKLREARQQVSAWKLKMRSLESERESAASRASYGNRTSVPGSLETWAAKADRLGREVTRARMALAMAKSKLEAISPRDPLLIVPDPTE